MPLLKREPDSFPTALFALPVASSPWWVAHVRSRQEKALARFLRPLGVPFYLPQHEHRVRRGGRNFVSYLPLFPGYLFFRGTGAERQAALRSDLIVKVLDVLDQDLLGGELAQLHSLRVAGASLVACDPVAPGTAVRIVDGPFQGYTGVVERGGERPRLVVSISILRKSVSVELERSAVALLPPSARSRRDFQSAVA